MSEDVRQCVDHWVSEGWCGVAEEEVYDELGNGCELLISCYQLLLGIKTPLLRNICFYKNYIRLSTLLLGIATFKSRS